MTVMYSNAMAGINRKEVSLPDGTTLKSFTEGGYVPSFNEDYCSISVNGASALPNQILKNGDRISVTPKKIDAGAL